MNRETVHHESAAQADATFEMNGEAVRALGYRIVDMIVEDLTREERRPTLPPPQRAEELEAFFGGALPQSGTAPEELLSLIQERMLPAAANLNHALQMGYVLSSPLPLPGLIEALVGTLRMVPYSWATYPASSQIEVIVARWLGEMVGYDSNAAGYMTTGGTWANLVGLAAARVNKAGWPVRDEGLAGQAMLVAYGSEEVHTCLTNSMELMGLGKSQLRQLPVDGNYRIRLDLLEQAIEADIAAGHKPFCLIGNAGTVNTGAVDPLEALADLAMRYDMWFHVDGAYGAFAAMVPEARPLFAGLERADSLVLDPHKWLNVPFEAGCILVKDWDVLADTFSSVPAYLRASERAGEHNHWHYGFELSHTDRALKVWLALRQYGVRRYVNMISSHIDYARHVAEVVAASADFELITDPSLSICCFRFVPADLAERTEATERYLDELNQALEMTLAQDGRAFVSGTVLAGKQVLRVCIVNYHVTLAGVNETMRLLHKFGQQLDKEMRQAVR